MPQPYCILATLLLLAGARCQQATCGAHDSQTCSAAPPDNAPASLHTEHTDTMTTCCPPTAGPGLSHDYAAKGTFEQLGDMTVYVAKGSDSTKAITIIYDIFGFTTSAKQVLQVSDKLAELTGATVAVPDIFRGNTWTLKKFPPKPEDDFMGWLTKAASWERVSADAATVEQWLKGQGVTKFGTIGFCWGASMALRLGASGTYSAVGGAHPAYFGQDVALAEAVKAPVIQLPAGDDNVDTFKAAADKGPYAADNVFYQFKDQTHGFCAARGDWDKPDIAAAASKAIQMFADFFNKHLA